jgi:opacity protein-like surface antigen
VAGLQVATQLRRFHPYANILFGRGEITYLNGGYQVPGKFVFYTASHDNVLSPGGGIDFSVSSAWSMKLDYQHQRYATPVVPSGYLNANAFMVGLEYRFVFARIERRKF